MKRPDQDHLKPGADDALEAPEVRELARVTDEMVRWLDRRRLRWVIGTGLALFLLGVLAVISVGVVRNVNRIDRENYADCREGNLPNGYIRLDRPHDDLAVLLLPILSCEEGQDVGRPVRLRADQERRYLRILKTGRLPRVDGGEVVGSDPLPAPRRVSRR